MAGYAVSDFDEGKSITFNAHLSAEGKIHPRWEDVVPEVHTEISACSKSSTRLQITDVSHSRWTHPVAPNCIDTTLAESDMKVHFSTSPENSMDFSYSYNGATIANFAGSSFIYSKQFIQLEFEYDTNTALFGIGERRGSFLLENHDWWEHSFWNHDGPFLEGDLICNEQFEHYPTRLLATSRLVCR